MAKFKVGDHVKIIGVDTSKYGNPEYIGFTGIVTKFYEAGKPVVTLDAGQTKVGFDEFPESSLELIYSPPSSNLGTIVVVVLVLLALSGSNK